MIKCPKCEEVGPASKWEEGPAGGWFCPACHNHIQAADLSSTDVQQLMGEAATQLLTSTMSKVQESPMAFHAPKKSDAKAALNAIRDQLGLDVVDPTWKEYLTVRNGSSNKYHYFAVFRKGSEFVAVNAHGRIGYPSVKVTEIDTCASAEEAIAACKEKSQIKQEKRGYQPDKFFRNESVQPAAGANYQLAESFLAGAASQLSGFTARQLAENHKPAPASLTEAKKKADEPLEKRFIQYIKDGDIWSPCGKVILKDKLEACPYAIKMTPSGIIFERVKANMDEVMVFKDSSLNKIVQEVDRFWNSKASYDRLGLMHNRGLLLYGPPGTGKSICLQQVTEMMASRGDIVFYADSPSAMSEGLKAFRSIEPTRPIVIVFEEAEEIFRYNEREMLRLMDGDAKLGGVLYLATTNYIEKMSPRSLRPGRFDKKVYIGPPTMEQRKQYLTHKLKGLAEAPEIENLAKKSEGFGFGHLRELIAGIYAVGDPVDEVLTRLRGTAPEIQEKEKSSIAYLGDCPSPCRG